MDRLIEGHLKQILDTIKHVIINPDGFMFKSDKQEIDSNLEAIETLFHVRMAMDYAGPCNFNEIWDYYEVHCLSDVLRAVHTARRCIEAEKAEVLAMHLYILIYRAYYYVHGSYTSKPPLERIADALEEMRDYYIKGDQNDKQ